MSIKSDKWIKEQCLGDKPIVSPFTGVSMNMLPNGNKCPSYGLTSYGYDVRLGKHFKFFHSVEESAIVVDNVVAIIPEKNFVKEDINTVVIDPCQFIEGLVSDYTCEDFIILPPGGFCLGVSMERIRVPRDCVVTCMGKSSIARCGIHVIVTPLEPEWEGYITLEISNITGLPIKLWAGMGITQLQFHQCDDVCEVSYADRNGKYQNQPYSPVTPL